MVKQWNFNALPSGLMGDLIGDGQEVNIPWKMMGCYIEYPRVYYVIFLPKTNSKSSEFHGATGRRSFPVGFFRPIFKGLSAPVNSNRSEKKIRLPVSMAPNWAIYGYMLPCDDQRKPTCDLVFLPTNLLQKSTVHVGEYTVDPMDPSWGMGIPIVKNLHQTDGVFHHPSLSTVALVSRFEIMAFLRARRFTKSKEPEKNPKQSRN